MLPNDTIIIIAVFSAVGAFIFILILTRVLRNVTSTSAPLPPIQPLAHHRELQMAKLEAAIPTVQTWYPNSSMLSADNSFGTPSPRGGSTTSLIGKLPPPSPDGTTLTDLSTFSPASSQALALPSPQFNRQGSSSSSLATSSEPGHIDTPSSASSSYISSPSLAPRERSSMSNIRTPQHPIPSRRQRPMSITSSHSTVFSKTNRNTIRGLPHSRFSQIQIVLPAPLATGTDIPDSSTRRLRTNTLSATDSFDRTSLVDRWVTPSDSSPEVPNIMTTPTPMIRHSRIMSQPTFTTSPSAPPVPRLPTMYNDSNTEQQDNVKQNKAD